MALDFFRTQRGISVDDILYLQGAGAPGTSADTGGAPVGSHYLDNLSGDVYSKHTIGIGTNKWGILATEAYVDNAVAAQVSWREPSLVNDSSSTVIPIGTAGFSIIIDGETVADQDRVLFSGIVGAGGPNIYVYDQITGLFIETPNAETTGDTTYIQSGTDGGKRYTYNGTAWVRTDQASTDELAFIRSFIGKNGNGSENPSYSSTNVITQSSDLETVIGELDANVGPDVINGNVVLATNTSNANIQALDGYLTTNTAVSTATNVTTQIVLDTESTALVDALKWIVTVTDTANNKINSVEVHAVHDVSIGGTTADFNIFSILRINGSVNGLSLNVDINGTDIRLLVGSIAAVDVKSKRLAAF